MAWINLRPEYVIIIIIIVITGVSLMLIVEARFHRIRQVGNLLKTWFPTRFPSCWTSR